SEVPEVDPSDGTVEVLDNVTSGAHAFQQLLVQAPHTFFYITVKQDDTDRAWSAPVWVSTSGEPVVVVDEQPASFCWSKNSGIYHRSNCATVNTISPQNLIC